MGHTVEPITDGLSVYQPPTLALHLQENLLRSFNVVEALPDFADFIFAVDYDVYPEYLHVVAVPIHLRRIIQVGVPSLPRILWHILIFSMFV